MIERAAERVADAPVESSQPWHKALTRTHWFVLVVASLGWLFDTMDQNLFNLVRTQSIKDLLGERGKDAAYVKFVGGWVTAAFLVGYAVMFILYMAIVLYGMNVMRSVVQEKTSRVVEPMRVNVMTAVASTTPGGTAAANPTRRYPRTAATPDATMIAIHTVRM